MFLPHDLTLNGPLFTEGSEFDLLLVRIQFGFVLLSVPLTQICIVSTDFAFLQCCESDNPTHIMASIHYLLHFLHCHN